MTTRRRKLIVTLTMVVVLAGVAIAYWVRHEWLRRDVILLVPEGWADLVGPAELATTSDADVLLIRRARSAAEEGEVAATDLSRWRYYLCDMGRREVLDVESTEWAKLDRSVITRTESDPSRVVFVKPVSGHRQFLMRDAVVELANGFPIGACLSPSDRLALVITAQLEPELTGFWGLPAAGSSKQHYHQVVRMTDPVEVGRSHPIPFVSRLAGQKARPGRDMFVETIWSADERFVVYAGQTSLCIVRVDLRGSRN